MRNIDLIRISLLSSIKRCRKYKAEASGNVELTEWYDGKLHAFRSVLWSTYNVDFYGGHPVEDLKRRFCVEREPKESQ